MRLEDKVALITGAASGMGASMARIFAGEGAKVVVADMLAAEGKTIVDEITRANGAALVIVNREPTGLDHIADLVLHAPIGDTMGGAVGVN